MELAKCRDSSTVEHIIRNDKVVGSNPIPGFKLGIDVTYQLWSYTFSKYLAYHALGYSLVFFLDFALKGIYTEKMGFS